MLAVFEINTLRIILNLFKLDRAYNMEQIAFLIFLGSALYSFLYAIFRWGRANFITGIKKVANSKVAPF
jgi:hypothetical protein